LPTPRGLSQAPTTFIGSWCQGIHHAPLAACHHKEHTTQSTPTTTPTHPTTGPAAAAMRATTPTSLNKDARVHYAVLKLRTPTPSPRRQPTHPPHPHTRGGGNRCPGGTTPRHRPHQRNPTHQTGPIPQDPTTCQTHTQPHPHFPPPPTPTKQGRRGVLTRAAPATGQLADVPPSRAQGTASRHPPEQRHPTTTTPHKPGVHRRPLNDSTCSLERR
jgi:hypothetical protein